MIYQGINIIKTELNSYVTGDGTTISAELGNIGEIIFGGDLNNRPTDIVISLINVEENRMSRDPQNYFRNGTEINYKNPPVNLYLTLLFTSVGSYENALRNLQCVIEFFQGKYVFDHSNTNNLDAGIEKLILDMVSLNLEQLHQLWSMLGGRYHPSVAYRMRMITIDSISTNRGYLIKEIEANYHSIISDE
jgi:hypothetical protein